MRPTTEVIEENTMLRDKRGKLIKYGLCEDKSAITI
jgi:hypothetical protein